MPRAIEIKGLKQLRKQIKRYPKIVGRHIKTATTNSLNEVKKNVWTGAPVGATGNLKGSFREGVKVRPIGAALKGPGPVVLGSFGSTLKEGYPYGVNVELGRRPGPISVKGRESLRLWVHRKLKPGPKALDSVTFLVARKISKKGYKGKFFFKKGVEKSRRRINKEFAAALDRIVRDLAKKG